MTKHSKEDPAFVEKFLRSIYVDDIVSGADDTEGAYQSYTWTKHILSNGGFNLRKLISNHAIFFEIEPITEFEKKTHLQPVILLLKKMGHTLIIRLGICRRHTYKANRRC